MGGGEVADGPRARLDVLAVEAAPGAREGYGSEPGANGSVPSASETPLKALLACM